MSGKPLLVVGSRNRKKVEELLDLLGTLGIEVRCLKDYPQAVEVEEDGVTFAENAEKKACQQAVHLGCWVLGEDSGLAVDHLNGAPGVYSARYSGPDADDQKNNAKLLDALSGVPASKRTAHYVCHAVLSDPSGRVVARSEGICRGVLRETPSGSGGFGYDPLFEIPEYHQTFGELGPAVKRCLSHRGRALRGLLPHLSRLVHSGSW